MVGRKREVNHQHFNTLFYALFGKFLDIIINLKLNGGH